MLVTKKKKKKDNGKLITVSVLQVPSKNKNAKPIKIAAGSKISDIITQLGETTESVLVLDKKSRKLVPHDATLSGGEELEVLSIVSGG